MLAVTGLKLGFPYTMNTKATKFIHEPRKPDDKFVFQVGPIGNRNRDLLQPPLSANYCGAGTVNR